LLQSFTTWSTINFKSRDINLASLLDDTAIMYVGQLMAALDSYHVTCY